MHKPMHAPKPTQYLAFDFGLKRIGVAFGNSLTKTASGVAVVEAQNDEQRFIKIDGLIKEWQPEGLVVGVPRQPDGADNELTARCERFARQLEGVLPCRAPWSMNVTRAQSWKVAWVGRPPANRKAVSTWAVPA